MWDTNTDDGAVGSGLVLSILFCYVSWDFLEGSGPGENNLVSFQVIVSVLVLVASKTWSGFCFSYLFSST